MKVLYFAWLKEKTGVGEEDMVLPDGVRDVSALVAVLKERGGGYADAFADEAVVRVAVNMEHVETSHTLSDDDEVAFFPPVTGG